MEVGITEGSEKKLNWLNFDRKNGYTKKLGKNKKLTWI
jgi:hypothetical protein